MEFLIPFFIGLVSFLVISYVSSVVWQSGRYAGKNEELKKFVPVAMESEKTMKRAIREINYLRSKCVSRRNRIVELIAEVAELKVKLVSKNKKK